MDQITGTGGIDDYFLISLCKIAPVKMEHCHSQILHPTILAVKTWKLTVASLKSTPIWFTQDLVGDCAWVQQSNWGRQLAIDILFSLLPSMPPAHLHVLKAEAVLPV